MTSASNSLVQRRLRKRSLSSDCSRREVAIQRNKSIRLQQSMSLHIQMSDLEDNLCNNCFVNAPRQTFDLTYLGSDQTLNPESLASLEGLKNQQWRVYSAGCIYNFNNLESDRKWLAKALKKSLQVEFERFVFDSYRIEIDSEGAYCPTENDHPAISISVYGVWGEGGEESHLQYHGILLSWCSPTDASASAALQAHTLPVLLCKGDKRMRGVVHRTLSDRLDVVVAELSLSQDELKCLATYSLAMLSVNDPFRAQLHYATRFGDLQVDVRTEQLVRLWTQFQPEDKTEVDLDTVLRFQDELHSFFELTYGIKFNHAHFKRIDVKGAFSLSTNSPMRFDSTKVGHVVLKFLTSSILHKLKLQMFEKSRNVTC